MFEQPVHRKSFKASIAALLIGLSLATPAQAILNGSCPPGIDASGPDRACYDVFISSSPVYDAALGISRTNAEAATAATIAAFEMLKQTGNDPNTTAYQTAYTAFQGALIAQAAVITTESTIIKALFQSIAAETGGSCLVQFEYSCTQDPLWSNIASTPLLRCMNQFLMTARYCIILAMAHPQLLTVGTNLTNDISIRSSIVSVSNEKATLTSAIADIIRGNL